MPTARGDSLEEVNSSGLLAGITVYAIRILTDNPWNGGGGYSYKEVGEMTQDQIYHRLANMDFLKKDVGERVKVVRGEGAGSLVKVNPDGSFQARDKHGNPIKLKSKGKSLAKTLREGQGKVKGRKRRRK